MHKCALWMVAGLMLMAAPALAQGTDDSESDEAGTEESAPEEPAAEEPVSEDDSQLEEAPDVAGDDSADGEEQIEGAQPLPDPRERRSVFDEPVSPEQTERVPRERRTASPPPPPRAEVYEKREPQVWPLTFGLKFGIMNYRDRTDSDASITFLVGYRHRPYNQELGPFTTFNLEAMLMDSPVSNDSILAVAPTIRAGIDWIPLSLPFPLMSVYGVASYILGPTFDYGTRIGVGFTTVLMFEITSDTYVKDGEPTRLLHLQAGFVF